jgi:dolichyl-phosphate-mannose-protein mannosyltransferase
VVYFCNRNSRAQTSVGLLTAIFVLALLALTYFAWPVYRAFLPLQILYSDAWNAYHADFLSSGRPLYQLDVFVSNNYPPLSFYLINSLSAATGVDGLYVGRIMSLAATVATSVAVWACVRLLGGSRLAATLSSIWWLASMARWYHDWIGIDDPHIVALALMTWALAYVLQHPNSDRAQIAIVVMGVAGFYKHNLVAIPAAALFWLTLHDRWRGLRATLIGLGTVGVGLAVCGAVFGAAFFHDMLLPRVYHISRVIGYIGLTQFVAAAMIIAVVWAVFRWQTLSGRFVLFFVVVALVSYLVQSTAEGVLENAAFELTVAVAIGLGCAFDDLAAIPKVRHWGLERVQVVVVGILIARLLLSLRVTPYLFLFSPNFRASLNERVSIMTAESARIAAIPGPVSCYRALLACRLAGKPLVFDPFIVGEYIGTGRISQREVAEKISERKIRFEAVDPRTDLLDLR